MGEVFSKTEVQTKLTAHQDSLASLACVQKYSKEIIVFL